MSRLFQNDYIYLEFYLTNSEPTFQINFAAIAESERIQNHMELELGLFYLFSIWYALGFTLFFGFH